MPVRGRPSRGKTNVSVADLADRRVLVATVGRTPQVVSETLFALNRQDAKVDGMFLITTTAGTQEVESRLRPKLVELAAAYPALWDTRNPLVVEALRSPTGTPLGDIRTREDSEAVARQIVAAIRRLSRSSLTLHGSVAGGRKTMSIHLTLGFQLYGRPRDRLHHVLVPPPAEADPGFFFPLPGRDVPLELAEVPFIRLGSHVQEHGEGLSITALLDSLHARIDADPVLRFAGTTSRPTVSVSGRPIRCEPRLIRTWRALAERRRHCDCGGTATHCCFVDILEAPGLVGITGDGAAEEFRTHVSKVKSALKGAGLTSTAQALVKVGTVGRRPDTRYGIHLSPERIEIDE